MHFNVEREILPHTLRRDVAKTLELDGMQGPDVVADRILTALFSSAWVPPHVVVDVPAKTLLWHVLSAVPHHLADSAVALIQSSAAKK